MSELVEMVNLPLLKASSKCEAASIDQPTFGCLPEGIPSLVTSQGTK